jgi:fructokinase
MQETQLSNKKAVCFGELLWDNLPSGRLAGGAPMNVAYHLRKLGVDAALISRVGNDLAGRELVDFLASIEIPVEYIQVDQQASTSEVMATLKANNEMAYTITYPTAWDFIAYQDDFTEKVGSADAFVFGSLASRHKVSRQTLLQLLEHAKFRVFDVNLRAPHYEKNTIEHLLGKAELVKLNENELVILGDWFTPYRTEADQAKALMESFDIAEILLTKGAEGGTYYSSHGNLHYQAKRVEVVDTVGSGDSFLAAFLSQKLNNVAIAQALDFASNLAAFVTSKNGACPDY